MIRPLLAVSLLALIAGAPGPSLAQSITCPPGSTRGGTESEAGKFHWCEQATPSGPIRQGPMVGFHPNGRRSFDEIRDQRFLVAETNNKFGWMLGLADRMGGWRLAPAELVKQLHTIEPPAPLVLISRRPAHRMNSRVMDPRGGAAAFMVSPEDAANAGLKDGSPAIVRSPHGAVKGVVKIDRTLRQGVMNVPHGLADEDNVNYLTHGDDVEPFTGMPRYSGLAVSLEPVPEPVDSAR